MTTRFTRTHMGSILFALFLTLGFQSSATAEDEYCPPELCDEDIEEILEVQIPVEEEDCPPEFCDDDAIENEVIEEEEDCPPEFCDDEEAVEQVAPETYTQDTPEERGPVDRTLYSRLTGAMRDNMYQHVSYDSEIEDVEQWITEGRLDDDTFTNTVLPIMKENCSKCHSTSSTMTKGIQELPLTSYEEIIAFTDLAPADSVCLDCHGDERLDQHKNIELASVFVNDNIKERSAHAEVPCVRCHFDLHTEEIDLCINPNVFSNYLDTWAENLNPDCEPTQPPACAKCHTEEADLVSDSIHFDNVDHEVTLLGLDGEVLSAPTCIDCHAGTDAHDVVISNQDPTSLNIVEGCGSCHVDLAETYFDSYHGKAALLGSEDTAKCYSCHGSHEMVSLSNLLSPVHPNNVEETCAGCHDDTNENFATFIPHADHNDKENYPILFYAFWAMNALLFGVFVFFGIHTALWFYRSIQERKLKRSAGDVIVDANEPHVRRFNLSHTIMHLMIIVSFLTLALTGMTLKFADNTMFQWIANALGGTESLGYWHRIGAIITGGYFAMHILQLLSLFIKRKITFSGLFKEDYTMIPLWRDVLDVKANVLYFVGKGPKPSFGRWTYWEKFDYLAVFWGVSVIGISGLMLWFPAVATQYLPGWAVNVAYLVHSEEAIMATIFIFVAHFFHTHLRPESAPLDPVVFTQRMPLSKFKEERPEEYKKLVANGELEERMLPAPSKWYMALVYLFGFTFVAIGVFLAIAILFSMIF